MRTEQELETMRNLLAEEYRKGYNKRNISEWISVTYTIRTLEWVLGLLDDLPTASVLGLSTDKSSVGGK
jgi:hypothetical protein